MTAGSVLILLLAACAAAFVLAPVFRPRGGADERASSSLSQEQDLTSQRDMALLALRDVEDDRATGKIAEKDYEEMKARLTAHTVEIMKRLDALHARRTSPGGAAPAFPAPPTTKSR